MRPAHSRRPRPGSLRGADSEPERGFILPVAIGASLLLLLGSLSLHSVALQGRLAHASREAIAAQEDALTGAAQQLVSQLNLKHPCLLSLPRARWSLEGRSCATPQELAVLLGDGGSGGGWRLLDWRPMSASAQALIELAGRGSAPQPRRGVFAVALLAEPLRAQPPRLLGLRGVTP
jgi:hypothetical protein